MEQKNTKLIFNELKADILALIDSQIKYAKLSAVKTSSRVGSSLIYILIILVPTILISFFGLTTLALFFSNIFHSYLMGFGLVSLIVLVALIVIVLIRKPLKRNIANKIINEIMNDSNDDDDDKVGK